MAKVVLMEDEVLVNEMVVVHFQVEQSDYRVEADRVVDCMIVLLVEVNLQIHVKLALNMLSNLRDVKNDSVLRIIHASEVYIEQVDEENIIADEEKIEKAGIEVKMDLLMQVVYDSIVHDKIVKEKNNLVLVYYIDEDHTVVINLVTVNFKVHMPTKQEEQVTKLESRVVIHSIDDYGN